MNVLHLWSANQKGERIRPVSTDIALFGANWPCFWGETAVGNITNFKTNWHKYKDGWKYVCGLALMTEPCVVYSLGSGGNMAIEEDLLRKAPFCEVHTFDERLTQWYPEGLVGKVTTHQMYISTEDDVASDPPKRSIPSIMSELNHTHIDILKVDIEGSEWELFASMGKPPELGYVGQLLMEVHTNKGRDEKGSVKRDLERLFDNLESEALRLFHREVNFRYGPTNCIEFAFIQKHWSPSRKMYGTGG